MKAFISYSRKDEAALERLHIHLAVLRREGHIDEWFDREILAGGEIDAEIAERLESSELFLLLVSPDFLASDYCVEREMERALERHRSGEARVVPIIVEPVIGRPHRSETSRHFPAKATLSANGRTRTTRTWMSYRSYVGF